MTCCFLIVILGVEARAQYNYNDPPPAQNNNQAGENGSNSERREPQGATVQSEGNSFVMEGLGVLALCGVALFGVCRGTNRGN